MFNKKVNLCGKTTRDVRLYERKKGAPTHLAQKENTRMTSESVSHSVVSDSVTPWTVACQAPLSMGFSKQEYWSGFPCPSPGYLPDLGIEPGLPYYRQTLYQLSHQGRPTRMRKVLKTKVMSTSLHSLSEYYWCAFHVPDSVLGTRGSVQ